MSSLNVFSDWASGKRTKSMKRRSKRKSGNLVPGIKVLLQRGEGLPSADSNGLSDPYVKFKLGKLGKHTSHVVKKTLDPEWNEEFFLPCPENTAVPLDIKVMDKDMIGSDYLGEATLDVSHLHHDGVSHKFTVELVHAKSGHAQGRAAGVIHLRVERDERRLETLKGKDKVKKWAIPTGDRSVVVELIEGRDLVSKDSNGYSDPYVSVRLGKVKHTSRTVSRSLQPKWRQRFEFPLKHGSDDTTIKFKVWDKDLLSRNDTMGSVSIDVDELQPKIVNERWVPLELKGADAGFLHVLVTVLDLDDLVLSREQRKEMVGAVKVHVVAARDLAAADFNGKSDPYVELSLGNARLRTPVVPKNLDPMWDTLIELPVKDIFTTLDVTVWDHDGGRSKPDFLGKLAIPLLDIRNGRTEWFALKGEDCLSRGQGEIQLALHLDYKVPGAYLGLARRREPNYMERLPLFSLKRTKNAVNRINDANTAGLEVLTFIDDVSSWNHGVVAGALGIVVWTAVCLFFRPWMVPLVGLVVMIQQRVFNYQGVDVVVDDSGMVVTKFDEREHHDPSKQTGNNKHRDSALADRIMLSPFKDVDGSVDIEEEDDEEPDAEDDAGNDGAIEGSAPKSVAKKKKKKKKKGGLLEGYRVLTRVARTIQGHLEFAASTEERVKNLFNWSVPLITALVGVGFVVAAAAMYFVHWTHLLMAWGWYRFARKAYRKFVAPKSKFHVPIIEAVELIGRVPSDIDKAKHARLNPTELQTSTSFKIFGTGRR